MAVKWLCKHDQGVGNARQQQVGDLPQLLGNRICLGNFSGWRWIRCGLYNAYWEFVYFGHPSNFRDGVIQWPSSTTIGPRSILLDLLATEGIGWSRDLPVPTGTKLIRRHPSVYWERNQYLFTASPRVGPEIFQHFRERCASIALPEFPREANDWARDMVLYMFHVPSQNTVSRSEREVYPVYWIVSH